MSSGCNVEFEIGLSVFIVVGSGSAFEAFGH